MLKLSILLLGLICFSQTFGAEPIESIYTQINPAKSNGSVISDQQKRADNNISGNRDLVPHLSMSKTLSLQTASTSKTKSNSTSVIALLNNLEPVNSDQINKEHLSYAATTINERYSDNLNSNNVTQRYEHEKMNYLLATILVSITAIIIIATLFYIRFSPTAEFQIARILRMVATQIKNVNLNRLRNIWS